MRRRLLLITIFTVLILTSCGQQGSTQGQSEGASVGDTLLVNYVGKFENGTVFDTNIQSVAEEAGIQKNSFQPLEVEIGSGQVIPGFENALIGMKVGDEKTVTIQPQNAYGQKNRGQVLSLPVRQELPRMTTLQRDVEVDEQQLQQLPGDNTIGETVEVGDIEYEIESIEDGTAYLRIDVDEGDQLQLPNTLWNSTVAEVNPDDYVVRQDPDNGSTVNTPFGPVQIIVREETLTRVLLIDKGGAIQTQNGVGRVTNKNETSVTVDFNHPLAGETLVFDIEVVGEG